MGFDPSRIWLSPPPPADSVHMSRSPAGTLGECQHRVLSDVYSTDRSWQDFDFSQKATLGFFFAIILSRNRLAFVGMLSLRSLQLRCFRRLLTSFGSLRRRSCLTMPRKASQTLCCMAADVSINLQSNTAAQARPSETAKNKWHVRRHVNSRRWRPSIRQGPRRLTAD